ncbi:MAG: hypothetical protein GX638_13680 [Crenarchaeota archaeon]|nr:hypothetical protein [Thermoproteota archaeon]
MKFSELRDLINHYDKMQSKNYRQYDEREIRIVINRPSVGARATVGIKNIHPGIDWENGIFLIKTDEAIDKKE